MVYQIELPKLGGRHGLAATIAGCADEIVSSFSKDVHSEVLVRCGIGP